MNYYILITSLLSLSIGLNSFANPYISVGQAKTKKTVVAFPSISTKGVAPTKEQIKVVFDTVTSDLNYVDLFKFIGSAAFLEKSGGIAPNTFKMTDWSSIGAEFLLKTEMTKDGNAVRLEAYLYDVTGAKAVFNKNYIAAPNEMKTLGHYVSNDVMNALTGLPGIFLTKIVMSCDRSGKKEIYMMDFDGTDIKQITTHKSIAMAPAWSPDGTKIAYSVYTRRSDNVKNLDLYEYDFKTNMIRMLSNRKGMNSGSVYTNDGKGIVLTMSFMGNPEIFLFKNDDRTVTRLTNSFGFDVDPTISPDGKKIAFVSSRSGMPMVFKMNMDGSQVERLTYAGRYNATPSWSPTNNKIAFAGWIDKSFDIFIMNPDGSNIERLTKGQGNNEDPHFSPDGQMIVFSSNRTGQENIYVMNIDGTFVRRLTYGMGKCVAPKWSSPPQTGK